MGLDIEYYLAINAQRYVVTQELLDWYKDAHRGREKWGIEVKYTKQGIHPHGSNLFCDTCDENMEIDEEVYIFFVGRSQLFYHVGCFENESESKQRNILYQDRARRKKFKDRGKIWI